MCNNLQALSRAMDLAPDKKQISQEVQEVKSHLTLEQLAEVPPTVTRNTPFLLNLMDIALL